MRTTTIHIVIVGLTCLAACEWNSDSPRNDASTQPRLDGRVAMPDADDIDADPTVLRHLLLTEVVMTPPGSEFIEITNPNATDISLADYYLADTGEYWKLPAGAPTINISDFIVKFPAGAMITGGASITVATGTAALFTTAYGSAPTYSIADSTVTKTVVPGTPTLTDAGEIMVLCHWDGAAALVSDVDMMIVGMPTQANGVVSKSGMALGAGTYATDANTIQSQTATPGSGFSTKRQLAEANHETQAGTGNGLDGDDETSEDTRMTWDSTFIAPTPGTAPTL